MTRILITSALPYINGVKHLGNLIGSQLPADTFARFMRLQGNEVLFICATDEHGTPAELAANEADMEIGQYCMEMWNKQKQLSEGFNLSFDHFGRSSSTENHKLTQSFAKALSANGMIDEVREKQIFSLDDDRFLPDRYIVGICPTCGYDKARGDQCESCTKQLDPTELLQPKSAISGSSNLETRETKHLYLKQSLMKEKLEEWISEKSDWPIITTSIAKKWLKQNFGIQIRGCLEQLGKHKIKFEDWKFTEKNPFFAPTSDDLESVELYMDELRRAGDSCGAKLLFVVEGMPVGLGEPVFDRLDADLAHALMGVNAVKGVEIGSGFDSVSQLGSEHSDEIFPDGFGSNNSGGVLGGISSGQNLVVRIAIKPTSSIRKNRNTVDKDGMRTVISTTGRHDPCVGIRATPIGEAMIAIVLMDHALRDRGQNRR